MSILGDTIRNICIFFIMITVVDNLLQGSVYRKYVKSVTGLMITLIIIGPVMKLLAEDDYKLDSYRYMLEYDGSIDIDSYYNNMLKDSLTAIVEEAGYRLLDSRWNVCQDKDLSEYGMVDGLYIKVTASKEDDNQELINKLADCYGIESNSIEIEID